MLVTSSTVDLRLFGYMTSSGVIALSLFHLFLQYPSDSKAVPEEASAILSTGTCVSQFSLCSTVCPRVIFPCPTEVHATLSNAA